MRVFRYGEYIDRRPAVVWDYMMDFSTANRWRTMVTKLEKIGDGPLRAGSRLRVEFMTSGKVHEREIELLDFEPGKRWVHRTLHPSTGINGDFEYLVRPEGTGTRVFLILHVTATKWTTRLLFPLLVRSQRRVYRQQLSALKRAVEQVPVS